MRSKQEKVRDAGSAGSLPAGPAGAAGLARAAGSAELAGAAGAADPAAAGSAESSQWGKGEAINPWARYGWLMAAVWLVFLIYPITYLLNSHAPTAYVWMAWLGMAGFVASYLGGFSAGMRNGPPGSRPSRAQWLCFWAMVAFALIGVPALGANALSYLPFIMSYASYGLTRTMHWAVAACSLLLVVLWPLAIGEFMDYLGLFMIVVILTLANSVSTFLISRSMVADELTIELATSESREAVARDVHDLIGHSLTVVKLKAQLARRLIDADPERARAELEDIERITGEALQGVRATVTGLRSEGLAAQLDAARSALGTAGIDLVVEGSPDALSPAQALPAGWILREATTNVLRHAGASRVLVRLAPGSLEVHDDGVGLGGKRGEAAASGGSGRGSATGPEAPSKQTSGKATPGNGLRGMAERAAVAGAVCGTDSSPLGGVKVSVTW